MSSDKKKKKPDVDLQNAITVWEHCDRDYSLAGRELKKSAKEMRSLVDKAKKAGLEPENDAVKKIVIDGKKRVIPMSQNTKKVQEATAQECIAELRRIQGEHDGLIITRNFFRKKSKFADSAWDANFGTFREFSRQAGLELTRGQHKLERDIAKHAASDGYREMNIQKSNYEGKYVKPNDKRYKTVISAMDVHDRHCDPFYRRVFMDTLRRLQPDLMILNGDIFDLYEFSKFTQDPRMFNPVDSITWVHNFIGEAREACPDMQIDFIEGNHEFRLLRHLSEASPAMKVILSDIHGMSVSDILGLDEFEVNYIARADLSSFTSADAKNEIGKNWKTYWGCFLASHYPKDRNKGFAGFNGHHHKHIVWSAYSPIFKTYEWHQCGAGHARRAEYCDAENWSNGFPILFVDTQERRTVFEYVDIQDHAVSGGKWYLREPHELLMDF